MHLSLIFSFILCYTNAFFASKKFLSTRITSLLRECPLELTGQLDPSKSWPVKFVYGDKETEFTVAEDCSLLEAAESLFDDVPSSCSKSIMDLIT